MSGDEATTATVSTERRISRETARALLACGYLAYAGMSPSQAAGLDDDVIDELRAWHADHALMPTPGVLTEAQFSMQCSYIAKNAAAWAGDLLTLEENCHRAADPHTVARFTDEMRKRLDRLDQRAGRGAHR